MTGDEREELNRLLAENRRLRESLAEHGIAWRLRDPATTTERLAHRALIPVTGQTLFDHLAGRHTRPRDFLPRRRAKGGYKQFPALHPALFQRLEPRPTRWQ